MTMNASPVDASVVRPPAVRSSPRSSAEDTDRALLQQGSFGAVLAAVQMPVGLNIGGGKSALPQVRDDRSGSGDGARQRRLSTLRQDDAQGRLPSDSRISAATRSAASQAAREAATSRGQTVGRDRATAQPPSSPGAGSTDSPSSRVETDVANRRTAAVTTTSRDSSGAASPTNTDEPKSTSSRSVPSGGRASSDVGNAPATTGTGSGTPSAGRRASGVAAAAASKAESATSGIRTAALRTQGAAGRPTADNAVQIRGRGDRPQTTGRSVVKASSASKGGSADRTPRDEITQRIARVVQAKVSGKDTFARIRLDPPELGTVRVNLHLKSDSVVVRLVADNADARDAIKSRLDDLRSALQQQGVRVDRLEVTTPSPSDVASESFVPDQTANHAGEGRRTGGQGRRRATRTEGVESPAEAGETLSEMFASVGSDDVIALRDGLDIRV